MPTVDQPLVLPEYDVRDVSVGIVHLGLGRFHRAHQAVYVDDVLVRDPTWGIVGVAPHNPAVTSALRRQGNRYPVMFTPPSPQVREIAAIREAVAAAEHPATVTSRISDPAVRLCTLTVTEKGYSADLVARRLDTTQRLRADANAEFPATALGLLVHGLALRRSSDAALTVMSCDNIADNGPLLHDLVTDFALLRDDGAWSELGDWIHARVAFASTVVDRMVPAVDDELAVVAEPFGRWYISGAGVLPPWSSPDVRVVPDVSPYARLKLRVVNGTHTLLAHLGLLAGHATLADAAEDADLHAVAERFLHDDVVPTLEPTLPASEVSTYVDGVLDRAANRDLAYPLAQIATDSAQKLTQRLVPTALDCLRQGRRPTWVALGVAAWILTTRAESDASNPETLARERLADRAVFPAELAEQESFREDVAGWVGELTSAGG